jgi:hypothetical protein
MLIERHDPVPGSAAEDDNHCVPEDDEETVDEAVDSLAEAFVKAKSEARHESRDAAAEG